LGFPEVGVFVQGSTADGVADAIVDLDLIADQFDDTIETIPGWAGKG